MERPAGLGLTAAIRGIQQRWTAARTRERLFVGRWGDFGPELYLVGRRVRRLLAPQDVDRGPASFARGILAEVMHCQPAKQLARAFADAQLEPLPPDGFVLSTSEVETWLESRVGLPVGPA